MQSFYPPNQIIVRPTRKSIFLAGTIDNGFSKDWQLEVTNQLSEYEIDIYNPRRVEWNCELFQTFENPIFYQQVNWELDALNKADYIVVNILPDSKSPITLLEIGLYATSGKLLICCPKKFYRSGNIQIVSNNYNIPLFENMDELLIELLTLIKKE